MSILRVGGKDPQGNAKGLNTDAEGNLISSVGRASTKSIVLFENSEANGFSSPQTTEGYSWLAIDVTGTFSANIQFLARLESGSTNRPLFIYDHNGNKTETINSGGSYFVNVAGMNRVYANVSGYSSGQITVTGKLMPLAPDLAALTGQQSRVVQLFDARSSTGYSSVINFRGYNFVLLEALGNFEGEVRLYGRVADGENHQLAIYDSNNNQRSSIVRPGTYKVDIAGYTRIVALLNTLDSGTVTLYASGISSGVIPQSTPAIDHSNYPSKRVMAKPGFPMPEQRLEFPGGIENITVVNYSPIHPVEIIINRSNTTQHLIDKDNRILIPPRSSFCVNSKVESLMYSSVFGFAEIGIYPDAKISIDGLGGGESTVVGSYSRNSEFGGAHSIRAVRNNIFVMTKSEEDDIMVSVDGGKTLANSYPVPNHQSCFISASGAILTTADGDIWRSGDYGESFQKVTDVGSILRWYSQNGIYDRNGVIIFAEYGGDNDPVKRIWRSADDGQNWTEVFSQNTPADIRHFHTLQYDKTEQRWIATSGDADNESHWFISDDDGVNWSKLDNASGSQLWRTLGHILPGDGTLIWGTDTTSHRDTGVYRVRWDRILAEDFDPAKDIDKLIDVPGHIYPIHGIGNKIIIGYSGLGTNEPGAPTLLLSDDLGRNWRTVAIANYMEDVVNPQGRWSVANGPDSHNRFYIPVSGDIAGRNRAFDNIQGVIVQL